MRGTATAESSRKGYNYRSNTSSSRDEVTTLLGTFKPGGRGPASKNAISRFFCARLEFAIDIMLPLDLIFFMVFELAVSRRAWLLSNADILWDISSVELCCPPNLKASRPD
mmetsp:Transcript_77984/g.161985  ORF Transcript_77984/g.161985 Transcript_77984/m.161985 type:complete len:111 (-) Transcript_77984:3630-3962(-)